MTSPTCLHRHAARCTAATRPSTASPPPWIT